jgi:hypothetical protein
VTTVICTPGDLGSFVIEEVGFINPVEKLVEELNLKNMVWVGEPE